MENQKIRRSWASITMLCLIVTQFTTGVFPIPISPVQSTYAAGFFIEKERITVECPDAQQEVTKIANRSEADIGDIIIYTLRVTNVSTTTEAINVEVFDSIIPELTFIDGTPTDPLCSEDTINNKVVCRTASILPGQYKEFDVAFQVNNYPICDNTIYNQAEAIADNAGPALSNSESVTIVCDTDTTRVVVDNDPVFRISKTDNRSTVRPSENLTYKMEIKNISNVNVVNLEVTDRVPDDTGFISASDSGSQNGSTVTWFFNINAGATKSFEMKVKIDDDADDGDVIFNEVKIKDGPTATDTTRIDDDDGLVPDLTIDKTANTTEALAGSSVSYTIIIRNTGGQDIQNAVLTDDYPEQYVNITDPGRGSDTGGRLTWNLGTLRANSTTVVRYNARLKQGVRRGTSVRNTATVRSGTITRTDDHVIVVPVAPQTGLGGFIKSLTKSNEYLSTYEDSGTKTGSETSRLVAIRPQQRVATTTTLSGVIGSEENAAPTNLPLMIWITTMLTGLGIGGMFGRKFLF